MHIVPAILPDDFEELHNKVARVSKFVPWVQIDLCDGRFVPSRTWPYIEGGFENLPQDLELPFWQDVNYEFDLMVADPVAVVDKVMELGGMRAVIHVGSAPEEEILKALRALEHYDMEAVLAIDNNRPLNELFSLLEKDHQVHAVQCMGIANPGFQRQEFDERVLERIKTIKEKYPLLTIAVDGAVNFETAELLITAGAYRLISGSAIFESGDSLGTIRGLEQLFDTHL
jgi:ribulose-phosphate 3-epimerase